MFLRMSFSPRKPRHPLLRIVLGLLGLCVLLVMIAFGVFFGLAMLAAGALLRLWTLRKAPARKDDGLRADTLDGTTLEGDFRVVSKPALPAR
jgi:hypothetical protein